MSISKRYKAALALAATVAGAVGTAPLSGGSFLGGMLHHGFLAGSIGGLADWFAVTALFRKPLGISYRTEIIIRNRQRIMDAIVDFAANDLLSSEHIMEFVGRQNLAAMLRDFVQVHGEAKLQPALVEIIQALLAGLDARRVAWQVTPVLQEVLSQEAMERLSEQLLLGLGQQEQAKALLGIMSEALQELLEDEALLALLQEHVEQLLKQYEGDGAGRSFIMGLIGLDGAKVTAMLREKAQAWLSGLGEDVEKQAELAEWLAHRLQALAQRPEVQQAVGARLHEFCTEDRLQGYVEAWLQQGLESGQWQAKLQQLSERLLQGFMAKESWQQQVDAWLQTLLAREISSHHDVLVGMIESRLGALSDKDLVEFAEGKVADDLQMIRINGSVVGALVGMGLYTVIYMAGQVMGR